MSTSPIIHPRPRLLGLGRRWAVPLALGLGLLAGGCGSGGPRPLDVLAGPPGGVTADAAPSLPCRDGDLAGRTAAVRAETTARSGGKFVEMSFATTAPTGRSVLCSAADAVQVARLEAGQWAGGKELDAKTPATVSLVTLFDLEVEPAIAVSDNPEMKAYADRQRAMPGAARPIWLVTLEGSWSVQGHSDIAGPPSTGRYLVIGVDAETGLTVQRSVGGDPSAGRSG
jgi:hypothetical protein